MLEGLYRSVAIFELLPPDTHILPKGKNALKSLLHVLLESLHVLAGLGICCSKDNDAIE